MMTYDREAEEIERELKDKFPRLEWHVSRAEELSDNPEEFYMRQYHEFQIICELRALNFRAAMRLDRQIWFDNRIAQDWKFASIQATLANYIAKFLFGKEDSSA